MTVVPTKRTLATAARLIAVARASTGADAAIQLGAFDPDQLPALMGVLLDAAAGKAPRLGGGASGRPTTRSLAIKCPTCHAEPFKPCRVPSGWATRPHAARLGKRCVRCGDLASAGRFDYCGPACRDAARKERDRAYSLAYTRRRKQRQEAS